MSAKGCEEPRFKHLKCCVLLPTYNNSTTIGGVINQVLEYTSDICVVNDGSTDNTLQVIEQFTDIKLLTYSKNKGKGWALRKGFEFARNCGYDYVITMDTDGQHFAEDLPVMLDALEQYKDAIIVGARNMNQSSVPGKSSFGNKFSNFWFELETGIKLPDTQSGYRLYPVKHLEKLRFFTYKYEFEIEVLVRGAWSGLQVLSVPVKVYYPPAEERISHFRPFQDFSRISVLNTVLVFSTFLWIKPRDFYYSLKKKALKHSLTNI
jgi:glycosyltransferase involved in cell wall biosynthesis